MLRLMCLQLVTPPMVSKRARICARTLSLSLGLPSQVWPGPARRLVPRVLALPPPSPWTRGQQAYSDHAPTQTGCAGEVEDCQWLV